MPVVSPALPPPLNGVTHDTNFARFVDAKRNGFAGSFTDFIDQAPGPGWTVTMPPSANPVANFERFLWAKQRGFPGSLDRFTRDGFSYTVNPGGQPPTAGSGVPIEIVTASSGLVADRSGGDLFRTIDLIIDALQARAVLRPASAEIERTLAAESTPTERREAEGPRGPSTVSLTELLLAETGPERTRFRVAPRLPQVPDSPEPAEIFHGALTASEARRALAEIRLANWVMQYRIAVGNAALSEWAMPETRRQADPPHDLPSTDLAALLLGT